MPAKVYVLCRFAASSGLYTPWLDQIDNALVEIVDEPVHRWQLPSDAGLIVTHLHYQWEPLHRLREIFETARVPILILADGILEYRNSFLHPGLPDGAMFQPIFGHKLACLGRAQARLIESWGNQGCCEVVGLPRLDQVQTLPPRDTADQRFRLLVASATTPAFDAQQQQVVSDSMAALKDWASGRKLDDGRTIEIVWRITPELAAAIGVAQDDETERPELESVLAATDAVLTTPSTVYLESALRGRPTGLLDFFHHPSLVPSAWSLRCRDHFAPVIKELADPPAAKLDYQNFILNDQLECHSPATPRMVQLIDSMLTAGKKSAQTGEPIQLADRILPSDFDNHSSKPPCHNLAQRYPDNPAFEINDRQRLQIELTAAIERLQQLPDELAHRDEYIDQLQDKNDQLKSRVRELHARVQSLRRRLGIDGPEASSSGESDDR